MERAWRDLDGRRRQSTPSLWPARIQSATRGSNLGPVSRGCPCLRFPGRPQFGDGAVEQRNPAATGTAICPVNGARLDRRRAISGQRQSRPRAGASHAWSWGRPPWARPSPTRVMMARGSGIWLCAGQRAAAASARFSWALSQAPRGGAPGSCLTNRGDCVEITPSPTRVGARFDARLVDDEAGRVGGETDGQRPPIACC